MLEYDRCVVLYRPKHEPGVCIDAFEVAVDGLRGTIFANRAYWRRLPSESAQNPENVARRATERGRCRPAIASHDDIQSEQPRAYDAV